MNFGAENCKYCDASFEKRNAKQLFCSSKCRLKDFYQRTKIERESTSCLHCSAIIEKPKGGQLYCSNRCRYLAHYDKNKDRFLSRISSWQERNKDKVSAAKRKYVQSHPEVVLLKNYRRRARKRNAEGTLHAADLVMLKERQQHCLCCGVSFSVLPATIDHIVPLSRGGANSIDNTQLLCGPCNTTKGTKTIDYRLDEAVNV